MVEMDSGSINNEWPTVWQEDMMHNPKTLCDQMFKCPKLIRANGAPNSTVSNNWLLAGRRVLTFGGAPDR
jgi:hypothetical protein